MVLTTFQENVVKECIEKGYGGLSLPLGSGKTIISLNVALRQSPNDPILVVMSKSLMSSWMHEIEKFYQDTLPFVAVHSSTMKIHEWKLDPNTRIVLTTPQVLAKYYKEYNIKDEFVEQIFHQRVGYTNYYKDVKKPYCYYTQGGGIFYSRNWGAMIVDEVQRYTNHETLQCQAIASICARHRWVLSGTLFDEPKAERILGYHIITNIPNVPKNFPHTDVFIRSNMFNGLREHVVHRDKNVNFVPPIVNKQIISHVLSKEEEYIYTQLKNTLVQIRLRATQYRREGNIEDARRFNSYKMVMLCYLRQALVCPIIPLASISLDAYDTERRSDLAQILTTQFRESNLMGYLDNIESVKSSRIKTILKHVDQFQDEKLILFSCYSSCLKIIETFLKNRPILKIEANMNIAKRGQVIENFRNTDNGVLLLSYQLGSEGLNLQCCRNVFLLDFWWNAGRTQQAIGRIFRFGQEAKTINVYMFNSNTALEKIIFDKQQSKLQILDELQTGPMRSKVPTIRIDDIIRLLEQGVNKQALDRIKVY